jgi:hypothetical protein
MYREAIKYRRWLHSAPKTVSLAGLIARFRDSLKSQIPVGYQDESGFHFGVKTAKNESNGLSF